MKITNAFRRFYFGGILKDILQNVKKIRFYKVEINITRFNIEELHTLMKILTGRGKTSLTKMENKEVVNFLEDIRLLLGNNGYTLQVDNEAWERLIKEYRDEN